MVLLATASNSKATCISHEVDKTFNFTDKEAHLKSISNPALPLEQELEILTHLTKFDLGRYLLEHKGLNGLLHRLYYSTWT
ncbi:MAG: hypothetical protein ACRYGR_01370 [Janthinobacterium lividum]